MASIFTSLNIGYSGLKTSQVAIDTVGHNIANAENPNYTRQRTVIDPNEPFHTIPGDVGLGAKIGEIVRVHDEFVYKRLKSASAGNEFAQFRMDTMDEISSYFPEIEKNGIYNAMEEYFDAWNDFSKNSDDSALKINLAQKARSFTATIRDTYDLVESVQTSIDNQLQTAVDEINRIGQEISQLNVRINTFEAGGNHANDLRDQRDKLELALNKLIDISVSKGDIRSDMSVDRDLNESGEAYHLSVGGASFVDGSTYHPILFERPSGERYGRILYQRQDYEKLDITEYVQGGKTGSMLALRDGDIREALDRLDSFAASLAMYTNNQYAYHAVRKMDGDVAIASDEVITNTQLPIDANGSFYVKIYDIDGNEVAKRKITMSERATFGDVADAINAATDEQIPASIRVNDRGTGTGDNIDDNGDGVSGNDVEDYVSASADGFFSLAIRADKLAEGYTVAIEEADLHDPSLFAGALGLARFFDERSGSEIRLNRALDENPTVIGGNGAPIPGDNSVANMMVEFQYQKIDFFAPYDSKNLYTHDTLSGFFRMSVTEVANTTAAAHATAETNEALLTSVINEFDSISKVDIDEELTNLMRYQTGYSASAKVITTIDQMIQTLLGIKQ